MIEETILNLIMGNMTGIAFGLLMYRMATTSIKETVNSIQENTKAIIALREFLLKKLR